MENNNNNGLKPINASLIPGVSILKKTLKVAKMPNRMVLNIQIGHTRSDEHNRRAIAIEALADRIKENMKKRNLKFSLHRFTMDVVERELINLAKEIGVDDNA